MPATTSAMLVCSSLNARLRWQKNQSVPRGTVGLETGTHNAASAGSGLCHAPSISAGLSSATAWPRSASRSAICSDSGRAGSVSFVIGRPQQARSFSWLVASSNKYSAAESQPMACAGPQRGFQARGQMAFFIFERGDGHAGRQLGLALPQGVARGDQFVDQFRHGAGHALRGMPLRSMHLRSQR